MKVLTVTCSERNGGAARAAQRIHSSIRRVGVSPMMYVQRESIATSLRVWAARKMTAQLVTDNKALHSPACVPSLNSRYFNRCNADIVHLHWINQEMMSTADIGRIRKPLVWTLHDMWAFCGAEHYTLDDRWAVGYYRNNRPPAETGFDVNRWTWNRKRRHWANLRAHIVAPSTWLASCARQSVLLGHLPISVIPNPLDVNVWRPINKDLARELLGLPRTARICLFGAIGGMKDSRKGFELLREALCRLTADLGKSELVIFGQEVDSATVALPGPVHCLGRLHDDVSLRLAYSAADVMVVPSLQEAFGQTATEAQACGTPVVAFDATGLKDIVKHRETGYLAAPFDSADMAKGIAWVLQDYERSRKLGEAARIHAAHSWAYDCVAQKYAEVYEKCLSHKSF